MDNSASISRKNGNKKKQRKKMKKMLKNDGNKKLKITFKYTIISL